MEQTAAIEHKESIWARPTKKQASYKLLEIDNFKRAASL